MSILDRLSYLIRSKKKAILDEGSARLQAFSDYIRSLSSMEWSELAEKAEKNFDDFLHIIEELWQSWSKEEKQSKGKTQQDYYREAEVEFEESLRGNGASGFPERILKYFATLEMEPIRNKDEVRNQWKKLMKKYHPDLFNQSPDKRETAAILTARLTQAYQEISLYLDKI